MWWICFLTLLANAIWQAWKRGPNAAAGTTSCLALLVPTWVVIDFFGLPLDVRVASGIAALSVYCLHPKAAFRTRLVWVDYTAIGLVTIHWCSDWYNDGIDWRVPIRVYGEWAVPYFLGRVALQSWDDVRELAPYACAVAIILGICATVEMLAEVSPFEKVFGICTVELNARTLSRWGFHRPSGPTLNPIYFGVLQLILFPWTLYAAVLGIRRAAPRWWVVAPVIGACGVSCSLSRAVILSLFVLLYAGATVLFPRIRLALIAIVVLGVALLASKRNAVLDAMHAWSGDIDRRPNIVVSGEESKYTGTLHRVYLFEVYGTAMRRAGWLGFGTDRTSTFPPRVPVGPEEAKTLKRLWSIDNTYILIVLRFGYLGVLCFFALGVATAFTYASLARNQDLRRDAFAAAMSGTILATLLIMLTVWMPHDFGFWFIWTCAGSAALRSHV